jgi:DNA/RNA-binding domain of Phe-tRNA-synthetase-like protein
MGRIDLEPHPLLALGVVEARVTPPFSPESELGALLRANPGDARIPAGIGFDRQALAPVYDAVRAVLRHGGFKPAGRSKPASEYLARARDEGSLAPLHPLVDVNNVVSLHTGLPASIVDGDLARDPLVVKIAGAGASYVFNPSGQEMDLGGLVCLHHGAECTPCANAVKDSMATKVRDETSSLLAVVYSPRGDKFRARIETALSWFVRLLEVHCGGHDIRTEILENDALDPPPET